MAWLRPNTFVPQHGIAAEEMNSLSNLGTSINFVRIRDDLPAISRDGTLNWRWVREASVSGHNESHTR